MKTWKIPVVWEMEGVVEVVADTLKEAVHLATWNVMPLPDNGKRLYDYFRTGGDIYYIRKEYNNGQKDEGVE